MKMDDRHFKPPSLAQQFNSPDGYFGVFGWLCGYSADEGFLDDAIERFVGQTNNQRAYVGRIALALLLDPGNFQISPAEVPGVLHLPLKGQAKPFTLLHAKVGLLGFRHLTDAGVSRLRLIVSSGNWTRETLEDSLDLAWSFDVCSESLPKPDAHTQQACGDLKAAWSMLSWLRGYFDCRALDAIPQGRADTESTHNRKLLERWVRRAIAKATDFSPRFLDNRKRSLLAQLPDIIRFEGGTVSRNYLAMGSGFYESVQDKDEIPSVLTTTVEHLQKDGLLTKWPEIDVFVNPLSCQAVAESLPSIIKRGWAVREAGKPPYFGASHRALHAKFVFSANWRANSNLCNSAWLYLGSGNLTGPGFTNQMNSSSGNLEAAVVLFPKDLRWATEKGVLPDHVIQNVLPVQWDTDFSQSPEALAPGNDMPERDQQFLAPPVSHLFWRNEEGGGWLRASEDTPEPFDVLDYAGNGCSRDPIEGYHWSTERPRQVQLLWKFCGLERRAFVPVIDEFGRFAATTLTAIDIDEAWWQLANFPMPPDDENSVSERRR